MAVEVLGSTLITQVKTKMGGYSNAFTGTEYLRFIQEGANEAWKILKELKQNYFVTYSQSTDSTKDNYFAKFSLGTREYTLPKDFREMRMIEVLTSGYEGLKFRKVPISHEDFQEIRRSTTQTATAGSSEGEYLYDLVGNDQLVLAQFPEAALDVRLWYVRSLLIIEESKEVDGFLWPFTDEISTYAARLAILTLQDQSLSDDWRREWREKLVSLAAAAGSRDSDSPQFVEDFLG